VVFLAAAALFKVAPRQLVTDYPVVVEPDGAGVYLQVVYPNFEIRYYGPLFMYYLY
jgi:hypothetical protein